MTCCYHHPLLSSIIIIYYYIPVNRSGAGSRFNHRRWSIHLYTRAPDLVPCPDSLNLYFDQLLKRILWLRGGVWPGLMEEGWGKHAYPIHVCNSRISTCHAGHPGRHNYHRIYRMEWSVELWWTSHRFFSPANLPHQQEKSRYKQSSGPENSQ